MDGRFGNAEALCGGADGGAVLDDIERQALGALLDVPLHWMTTP